MLALGDLPGGDYFSIASAVSGTGSFVAGVSTSSVSPIFGEGFRWSQESGLEGLGVLAGSQDPTSVPWGISSDGLVVVGWAFSSNGREAFRWSEAEGMVGLGDLPSQHFDSWATSASADGSVIVGLASSESGPTSFRWTSAGGMTDLGKPPGALDSQIWGVSDDGTIAVGDAALPGDLVPAVWHEGEGMRNLVEVLIELGLGSAIAGWDLEHAHAISADGLTIVGWGYNPSGNEEAWLAYLGPASVMEIPTTSTASLLVLGALLGAVALLAIRSPQIGSR